jgi:hypothetical protein
LCDTAIFHTHPRHTACGLKYGDTSVSTKPSKIPDRSISGVRFQTLSFVDFMCSLPFWFAAYFVIHSGTLNKLHSCFVTD